MCADPSSVFKETKHGLTLKVRARPGIKHHRDPRVADIGDGQWALEVTVSDAAIDGKANKAIEKEIASWLNLRKADVHIKSGQRSRIKNVEVIGDGSVLLKKVSAYV